MRMNVNLRKAPGLILYNSATYKNGSEILGIRPVIKQRSVNSRIYREILSPTVTLTMIDPFIAWR